MRMSQFKSADIKCCCLGAQMSLISGLLNGWEKKKKYRKLEKDAALLVLKRIINDEDGNRCDGSDLDDSSCREGVTTSQTEESSSTTSTSTQS